MSALLVPFSSKTLGWLSDTQNWKVSSELRRKSNSQVTQCWSSPESLSRSPPAAASTSKAFARSSQQWSHKRRAIHTYDTRSRGPACAGHQQHQHVHLVPSTGRKGPWVYPPVMVPPSISVHSEQTWWIMANMNILLYEYIEYNILII